MAQTKIKLQANVWGTLLLSEINKTRYHSSVISCFTLYVDVSLFAFVITCASN